MASSASEAPQQSRESRAVTIAATLIVIMMCAGIIGSVFIPKAFLN